jgi:hypothetical protein
MKKTGLLLTSILAFALSAQAQWTISGNNLWAGNYAAVNGYIGIGNNTPTEKLTIGPGTSPTASAPLLGMFGYGLTGTLDQRLLMYADKNNGLLFEAPKDATGARLPIQFNWRSGSTTTPPLYIKGSNSYVGIGTSTPAYQLDVAGTVSATGLKITGGTQGQVLTYNASGLATWQAAPASQWTTNGANINYATAGYVGIGSTNPDAKLTVNGAIHTSEVKVDLSVPGPDYVFEKNYNLLSLDEIKTYIDQNKHLPEVPSAKEMEKNGVQLGEMNMLLLKKVEELTLHLIEMKQENENLKSRIDAIEKKK